jgi:hypothetical protein
MKLTRVDASHIPDATATHLDLPVPDCQDPSWNKAEQDR